MSRFTLLFFVFLFASIVQLNAQSQNINPAIILSELTKRGITEQEARDKLKSKGIDIDKIPMEQFPKMQRQIEEAIAELQREKQEKLLKEQALSETEEPSDTLEPTEENTRKQIDNEREKKEKGVNRKEVKQNPKKKKDNNKDSDKAIGKEKGKNEDDEDLETSIEGKKDSLPKKKSVIYGQKFSDDFPYMIEKDYKAPDSYVLNKDDKITITVSNARIYDSKSVVIDKEGYINITGMPRTNLRGMTLGNAKKSLFSLFRRFYPIGEEDITVVVSASRTVSVNIGGEVEVPGTYNMSAGNSAFNALSAAKGLTSIGSVRKIQLVRTTGEKKRMDIYKFLLDPSVSNEFYLQEGDFINVGVVDKVVKIEGAVMRPYKYELIEGENLMKLIEYAGGLAENAYQSSIQVKRFVNDAEKIIDVNYKDLKEKKGDFTLSKGDVIIIKRIPEKFRNFAVASGAVQLEGNYEITEGMRVSDLLKRAQLKKEAKTDIAFITRTNPDNTFQLKFINLDNILKNSNDKDNLILQSKDSLLVFDLEQFSRKDSVFVAGAVRNEVRFAYDVSQTVRVSDALTIAGGAIPTATNFAYIVRRDTFNKKILEYIKIDVKEAIQNPFSKENIRLMPNDSIYLMSKENFIDEGYIKVTGAVRRPGEYKYAKSLTLFDALVMANGLKLEAATNRVDIFRIVIDSIQPVRNVVATIEIDKSMNILDARKKDFQLEPYDQIVVRSIPEFSFQKIVNITGEVKYPGQYALLDKNEKLLSVIQRAGGLTSEAFDAGTTLYRSQDNIGYVIIQLKEAMKSTNSNFNIIMKEGDVIDIPKAKDIVTLQGATNAFDLYSDKILSMGKINIAFEGEKSAWYYVNKYGAGVSKDGRKRLISVIHPNGEVQRTRDYLFFKVYPKVQKGSVVTVGYVEKKIEKKTTRKEIDWSKVLSDSIAQATALLSFILLINNIK
jgi:protein involved in polysaccharide export with SLBB domain